MLLTDEDIKQLNAMHAKKPAKKKRKRSDSVGSAAGAAKKKASPAKKATGQAQKKASPAKKTTASKKQAGGKKEASEASMAKELKGMKAEMAKLKKEISAMEAKREKLKASSAKRSGSKAAKPAKKEKQAKQKSSKKEKKPATPKKQPATPKKQPSTPKGLSPRKEAMITKACIKQLQSPEEVVRAYNLEELRRFGTEHGFDKHCIQQRKNLLASDIFEFVATGKLPGTEDNTRVTPKPRTKQSRQKQPPPPEEEEEEEEAEEAEEEEAEGPQPTRPVPAAQQPIGAVAAKEQEGGKVTDEGSPQYTSPRQSAGKTGSGTVVPPDTLASQPQPPLENGAAPAAATPPATG